jgi:hypothetical protein
MSLFSFSDQSNTIVIDNLDLFCAQVLEHPSHRETVATWKWIEKHLPAEHQERLLFAWNKHLAGENEDEEIVAAVEQVLEQIDGPFPHDTGT